MVVLGERYRLRRNEGWWQDGTQVEPLAARAAWAVRYDSADWDPPGKLALLYNLERVRELIRGSEPFHRDRDRVAFARYLIDAGCQPPTDSARVAGRHQR